ncbi:ParA family protein [Porticoccus sp.]
MQRIVVINPKGGSGKTMLATNLASYFSAQGKITTLMDLDPQGSSVFWALKRPDQAPHVQLVDAHNCPHNVTRSWAIQPPRNTEVLILDTPARPDLINLSPLLREATAILLPALLAEFDLHAVANTVQHLRRLLPSQENMALVANRAPQSTSASRRGTELDRELKLPVIASLRDSRTFLQAAADGMGVWEMKGSHYRGDKLEIAKIAQWCSETASGRQEPLGKRLNPDIIALATTA